MAEKKNQHYVPRRYLRNFLPGEKKAICLYNLPSKKARSNASIKHQCSVPYFYGKDLVIENALQDLEGEVARIIRDIIRTGTVPKPLKISFWCKLQESTMFNQSLSHEL